MTRRTALVLAGLVLAAGLAGCSSRSPESSGLAAAAQPAQAQPGQQPLADSAAQPERAPEPGKSGSVSGTQPGTRQDALAKLPPVSERQVIRTATLGVQTEDITGSTGRIRQITQAAGGYTSDESTTDYGGTIKIKVPNDKFDGVLDEFGKLSDKVTRTTHADDVTDQLVDIQSRMATAQASVDRVRALLSRANSIGDIVQLESELTRRTSDLESLQQRQAKLAGQVALSTVTVNLSKPGKSPEPAPRDDDDGFLAGLSNGWSALLASLRVLLLILGSVLPWVIAFGVPAYVAWRLIRLRRKPIQAAPAVQAAE
jgi:hypothetical protein